MLRPTGRRVRYRTERYSGGPTYGPSPDALGRPRYAWPPPRPGAPAPRQDGDHQRVSGHFYREAEGPHGEAHGRRTDGSIRPRFGWRNALERRNPKRASGPSPLPPRQQWSGQRTPRRCHALEASDWTRARWRPAEALHGRQRVPPAHLHQPTPREPRPPTSRGPRASRGATTRAEGKALKGQTPRALPA
jgi:hypothetical protein